METKKKKIGFILNPNAGIGGKAGLKGSDNYKKIEKLLLEGCERTAPKSRKLYEQNCRSYRKFSCRR